MSVSTGGWATAWSARLASTITPKLRKLCASTRRITRPSTWRAAIPASTVPLPSIVTSRIRVPVALPQTCTTEFSSVFAGSETSNASPRTRPAEPGPAVEPIASPARRTAPPTVAPTTYCRAGRRTGRRCRRCRRAGQCPSASRGRGPGEAGSTSIPRSPSRGGGSAPARPGASHCARPSAFARCPPARARRRRERSVRRS